MITHKKGIRLAVMVAMLTVAALALPAELAFAHATPINYLPAELSTLATSPGEISIEFSERIEQSASSMKLFPPQGEVLVLPARVDQNNPRKFEADLGPLTLALPDGTYTLSWQVVSSDDGHYTKGAYSFAVGTSSALAESGGSVEMVHSSSIIEAFTVFLKLIGESMMIGLLVLLALALRLGAFRDLAFRDTVARYSVRFLYLSAFILATGAISYFVLKTMKLAEVQEIPLISALPKYAVTTGGEMTITLIILLVAFLILSRGMIEKLCGGERFLLRHWVAIVFLVLISYTQARLSHAAASHILPVFSVLMNIPHLIGKGLWVGGLIALIAVFFPALSASAKSIGDMSSVRTRIRIAFGYATALAAFLGGVSGVWIVWLHLKSFGNILSSPWGGVFIFLLAFAVILGTLRLISLFVLDRMPRCLNCERSFMTLEAFAGLGVSFFSAVIIITSPPLTYAPLFEASVTERGSLVHLADPGIGQQTLHLFATDEKGVAVTGAYPTVTLSNKEANIGPIVIHPREKSGMYELPATLFTPHGVWEVSTTLSRSGAYDLNAKFNIRYPEDIASARLNAEKPSLNAFAMTMISLAIGMVLLSALLFMIARWNFAHAEKHKEIFVSTESVTILKGIVIALLAFLILSASVYIIHDTIVGGGMDIHAEHQM